MANMNACLPQLQLAHKLYGHAMMMMMMLDVFHTSHLRSICGIRLSAHYHVSNVALLRRCRMPALSTLLSYRRLQWLGHVARMPSSTGAYQLLHATAPTPVEGARLVRHLPGPRALLWTRHAREDLQRVGYEATWRLRCQDKAEWQRLLRTTLVAHA